MEAPIIKVSKEANMGLTSPTGDMEISEEDIIKDLMEALEVWGLAVLEEDNHH